MTALCEENDADKAQRVHLSHFLNHTSSPRLETFPASFIEPCAYWSHAEKASFFRSLARHSRWKPDLIAEDIGGGKTIADVCSYLSLLEHGSACESQKRYKRDAYPIAHELSEEWIAVEKSAADGLCGREADWQKAALKHKRTQELKEVKNSLRKGLEIVGGCGSKGDDLSMTSQNIKRSRQPSNEEDEAWEERFKVRKRELAGLWKREDMLSSLDGRYLKTMDKMVRTLESTEADKVMGGGGQLELEDNARDKRARLEVSASSEFPYDVGTDQPEEIMSNDNEVTSQILLAIDRNVANAQMPSLHSSDKHCGPLASSSKGLQPAVPFPSHTHASMTWRTKGSAGVSQSLRTQTTVPQSPRPSPTPFAEIPRDLSPASRRRLRKRLWTRRKRAMESGLPISEVPMDTGILKRGRKAKSKPSGEAVKTREDDLILQVEENLSGVPEVSSHPPTSQGPLHSEADAVNEAKDEESDPCPNRKPYGWSKLTARQVSGETLRADGMDLFHLEKFVSIMSLLDHVHTQSRKAESIDELEDENEGPSNISYPLLRLLRACVIRFVTCLVAHAVLHKDVETRQKRRIRVIFQTGGADEIRVENIREALLHVGKDATTKPLFTRLKRTLRKAVAAQAPSGNEKESEPRDTDDSNESDDDGGSSIAETEDDTSSSTSSLSLPFNPVFQNGFPPPCAGPRPASPLFWNPSVLSTFGGKKGDDVILPDKIDEDGLWKELRAEEKIDEADREAARVHEHELWMEIGVTRMVEQRDPVMNTVGSKQTNILVQKSEGTEVSRHLNTKGRSLRFRRPGGSVKSRVFINSDEDL